MKLLACLITVALAVPALVVRAELIPSARLVDWTPGVSVGVPGGIPTNRTHLIDVTQAPYSADSTGTNDASAAIQSAINAAKSGDVIYLPAGTYRLVRGLTIGSTRSGITLRGSGEGTVIRNETPSTGIFVGSNSDYAWTWPSKGSNVTAGLQKGSTELTMADTTAFKPGQLVRVTVSNDPSIPVVSVNGYEGMRRQTTRVTAKTATTLSVFPALYGDYSASPTVVHVAQFQVNNVGIEDMLIDSSNSTATFTIWMEQCYGCWIKNVHVKLSANYHIFLNDSLNCEVRHCFLDQLNHAGSNGGGVLCNTISGCLVEDNIIYKAFPLIEVNHGSCGNVFAYNYLQDSAPGVAIDTNHGPHNEYNLYEGNVTPNLQCDGYFGSASNDTIFRNWINAIQNGKPSWAASLNRFTRNYSLIGNIIQSPGYAWSSDGVSCGNPNMGNANHVGMAPPWSNAWQYGVGTLTQAGSAVSTSAAMFTPGNVGQYIMTPATNMVSLITAYTDAQHVTVNSNQSLSKVAYIVTPGSAGYQELDTGVAATLVRKGNYYYSSNSVPIGETTGTDTLPASLYRSSKPDWFGSLSWPAFDPAAPNADPEAIPAGYRFAHGVDPTDTGRNTTPTPSPTFLPQKPMNVRVTHPQR